MDFIFIVGVEGSGHNMMRAVLEDFLRREDAVDQGGWHPLWASFCDPDQHLLLRDAPKPLQRALDFLAQNEEPCPELAQQWAKAQPGGRELLVRELFKRMFSVYRKQGKRALYDSASLPYQNPRNSIRRPDIHWLREIIMEAGLDCRWLVLNRPATSLAWSGYRRKFTEDLYEQARVVEDNAAYIATQLATLDTEDYRILNFELFLSNPMHYSAALADWLRIDHDTLNAGLRNLKEPTKLEDIPDDARLMLERFFSVERTSAWEAAFSNPRQQIVE